MIIGNILKRLRKPKPLDIDGPFPCPEYVGEDWHSVDVTFKTKEEAERWINREIERYFPELRDRPIDWLCRWVRRNRV
jgi:hypothetical protein